MLFSRRIVWLTVEADEEQAPVVNAPALQLGFGRPPGLGAGRAAGPYPSCALELYDLEHDIGEQHNVINQRPDLVAHLPALAEKARVDLRDRLAETEGKNRRPAGKL